MSIAQQAYRTFTKRINQLILSIYDAIEQGETYSIEDVSEWFDEIKQDLLDELSDSLANYDLWDERSTKYIDDKLDELSNILSSPKDKETEDIEDNLLTEFNELTEEDCRSETPGLPGNGVGIPRNVILLTAEEVVEYSKGIPFELIKGFIPVYNQNGDLKGWKPCILKDTW